MSGAHSLEFGHTKFNSFCQNLIGLGSGKNILSQREGFVGSLDGILSLDLICLDPVLELARIFDDHVNAIVVVDLANEFAQCIHNPLDTRMLFFQVSNPFLKLKVLSSPYRF